MKITIHNTSKTVKMSGKPHQVWEGRTERGCPVWALVQGVHPLDPHEKENLDWEKEEYPGIKPSPQIEALDETLMPKEPLLIVQISPGEKVGNETICLCGISLKKDISDKDKAQALLTAITGLQHIYKENYLKPSNGPANLN